MNNKYIVTRLFIRYKLIINSDSYIFEVVKIYRCYFKFINLIVYIILIFQQ